MKELVVNASSVEAVGATTETDAGDRAAAARACPVCDADNSGGSPHRFSRDAWTLRECPACGLVYLENPPAYEALEDEFAWEQTYEAERARRREGRRLYYLLSDSLKAIKIIARGGNIYRKEKRIIGRHVLPGRILDIGCGDGCVFRNLPDGMTPFGVEVSPHLARLAGEACEPLGGSVVQAPAIEGVQQFEPDSFDGVLMRSFLEHEAQPLPLLRHVREILKTGGRVIIKVPNFDSMNRHVRGAAWCGFRFPDHVNYFTPDTLKRLVERAGYRVRKFGFFDRFPFSDNMWIIIERPGD